MRQTHIHLRFLAAVLLFLPGGSVLAGEANVEVVPAGESASRHVTMHAENVTAQQAVDQFAKASGMTLEISTQQGQPEGPTPVIYYDVDIKDMPLERALDQLGKTINRQMQMQQGGGFVRVMPYNPIGFFSPFDQGSLRTGALAVSAQSVSHQMSFPVTSMNPPYLEVDFQVVGGGTQMVFGEPRVTIDQATDDQGNSLASMKTNFNSFQQMLRITQVTPSARLKYSDPPPKKIASLKGTVEWLAPSTMARVTFKNLRDGKPTKIEFNGIEAQLAPPHQNGSQWEISLKLHRGANLSIKDWNARKDPYTSAFMQARVSDSDGKVFANRGGGSGGGPRDETQAQLFIARDDNEGSKTDAAPDTLVWEVVQDTTALRVPFEASDLPVP
jgi:hypothetical protein